MRQVTVSAPARLHLGFVGLNGDSASKFGALGLAIERPAARVLAQASNDWNVSDVQHDRVWRCLNNLISEFGLKQPLKIRVTDTIPAHIGLGSGTQLALAVATACMRLNNSSIPIARLSHLLRRGERSGIGTAAFSHGGFLVDCQADTDGEARSITRRLEFPEDWRILLIFDVEYQGAHGDVESDAFRELGGFSPSLTRKLQQILLNQVLPALESRNLSEFGEGITTIQRHVGDFFSPIQGGRFLSPDVADVLAQAEQSGATGTGQSSWGPTGFVIMKSEASALELQQRIQATRSDQRIRFEICRGRNVGAQVRIE